MTPQHVDTLQSRTDTASERLGSFQSRHIGPDPAARDQMLAAIGVPSLDALIHQTIPPDIRLTTALDLPAGDTEQEYLRRLRGIAARNRTYRSFIGHGYYDCVTPAVILRNVLENPGWYTPYTPYQAEIAQAKRRKKPATSIPKPGPQPPSAAATCPPSQAFGIPASALAPAAAGQS